MIASISGAGCSSDHGAHCHGTNTLDLLDALVCKSVRVADRSAGRTRFSMLATIRQFAEDHLVARGEACEIRAAHSRYFAEREADILALETAPDSGRRTTGLHPNCVPAHRIAVGRRT